MQLKNKRKMDGSLISLLTHILIFRFILVGKWANSH